MPDFTLNQRVRHVPSGEEGRVTAIHDFVDIMMDSGIDRHCQLNGDSCCNYGPFEPAEIIAQPPAGESKFTIGQRCSYWHDGQRHLCTVTEITDTYVRVELDPNEQDMTGTRSFNPDGNGRSGEPDAAVSFGVLIPVREPAFTEGARVTYHMSSSDSGTGTVEKTDELYIYVKLDEDQTHIRYVERVRIFNLDGSGTGTIYNNPRDTRCTEVSARLGKALPKWEMTPGREYPEEPRVAYGVFDSYYGRPIEKDNPGGYAPQTGWGVINPIIDERTNFSQCIYQNERDVLSAGYLTQAKTVWKDRCLDIDLAAIENPFDVLKGCEIHTMWLHADSFGCEFYFPETLTLRNRRRLNFNYPRACCTAGLVTMDELNAWFTSHAGAMRVVDVDGTKITLQSGEDTIEFHILPKLMENFKPTIVPNDMKAKELLLQNLATHPAKRDSTQDEGLAIAA